jgi:hypothetical protein
VRQHGGGANRKPDECGTARRSDHLGSKSIGRDKVPEIIAANVCRDTQPRGRDAPDTRGRLIEHRLEDYDGAAQ